MSQSEQDEPPLLGRVMDRRALIASGAALAAGLAVGTGKASAAAATLVSAGYITGSSTNATLGASIPVLGSAPLSVVPASQGTADGRLANQQLSARVLGLYPAYPPASIKSVLLEVLFPAGGMTAPFGAWSCGSDRRRCSSNVCFSIPISSSAAPAFRITTVSNTGAKQVFMNTLKTSPKTGELRLQRGYYLLGLYQGLWAKTMTVNPAAPNSAHLSVVVAVGV